MVRPSSSPRANSRTQAGALGASLLLAACAPEPAPATDPGALIDVSFESRVGVLLDTVPEGAREALATQLLAEDADFWRVRAGRQVETALYRLVYRNLYVEGLGQLPLPPVDQWVIAPGAAERGTIDGHDYVFVDYTYAGTLLAPLAEAALADPALATVGGMVDEPFVLPADPESLLERTGYACMNESDFPPNSVDTENARQFFDDTCERGESECHITEIPGESCLEALENAVGRSEVMIHFERIPWDDARADEVRVGAQRDGGPQLRALDEGVRDHRIVYRYFPADSCAISEGCVGGSGWRRLLQFTATVQNLGDEDVALGDVGPTSPAVVNRLVSFSECHRHMHFNHYGRFEFGDGDMALGGKRAFCLESTSRYFNNEDTPLTHPYSCAFQGVAAGWGDDYIAGLDCQWVDVTSIDATGGVTAPLRFIVNPDEFLCEGALVLDEGGNPTFEPTEFRNEAGEVEQRFVCDRFPDANADNAVEAPVTLPEEGGLATAPCRRFLVGAERNCDYERQPGELVACTPGETLTLSCTAASSSAPVAVRVCEGSHALGGIPCLHNEALGVAVVEDAAVTVEVSCPVARDTVEVGGLVSVFRAGVVPGTDAAVTCTAL